ncbi:ABC transporter ATP-binding protein [Solwaraspora sp. WMMA2080]|uniref:ATP-binding cassette domain-containing protein n=1 Tax=unclassified Solwaraspora TaxID=2627926 RepID=UPI00248CD3FD|nr:MULTISPECIES: ABC transporter ATP-binding protein [unclassified Solwaraspora]WBB95776.1 ABC transporter ATP-binding protein [Solwaraspora sp. WMMA2059]WBC20320.1 ABC transporter ATP-binding protein [Solwaraspora sp. WMMA2080]
MTGLGIETRNLTVRYGDTVAVDSLDLTLVPGKIYGLLGRNGSGKTSLLAVLSAFRAATSGTARIGGADPFENAAIMSQITFVRDRVDAQDTDRVGCILDLAATLRPNWDADYAARLVERFDLPMRKRLNGLSRGMKSALSVTLGLAARAPLTIFDEAYLGLDAPSRYAFYEEVLNDYLAHPRTIVLSTHLIEEVGSLFEEVVVLHRGRLVAHEETETLRARGTAVTGPAAAVDAFVTGRTVLGSQQLGGTRSTTVFGAVDDGDRAAARAAGLELGPIGLQDLFVHLTADTTDKEARR